MHCMRGAGRHHPSKRYCTFHVSLGKSNTSKRVKVLKVTTKYIFF